MVSGYNMDVNVLIAGAGPAGTSMSLFLSRKKIPHLIIDKAIFPRDKICGDALSGKVMDVLKKLDGNIPAEIDSSKENFTGSYGVKFAAPNGKFIDIPFKKDLSALAQPPGFISKRVDFDHYLFRKIDRNYATVMENCAVKDLIKKNTGVECLLEQEGKTIRVFTKMIVGAEGDRSVVAKKFSSIQKDDSHYCAGLRAYYKGVTGFHEMHFIELHFLKELLPGYLWIFPLPNGEANVGVGMLSKEVGRRKINLKKVMLEAIANNPTIKNRFANAHLDGDIKGWGLPLGSKKRKISGDNFLLLGDAASLIDPFTGEGIGNAMVSGMIAAHHVSQSLEANQFDEKFHSKYDEEIYKSLWDELKLSHTLQKLSKYSWLFNYVVSKAERNETLRDTITCMFDDLDMRDRLRSPKFYLKLMFGG
jgi:geranylgeranyl reductase family protein